MTDTAREEAVERGRALAEGAMQPHEWGYRDPVVGGFVEDRTPFDLADHVLRLLLSGGEGGRHLAKDALPRGETHPDTPSQPSAPEFSTDIGWRLIDKGVGEDWQALGLFPKNPPFHLTIYDERQNDMTVGPLSAREADKLGRALIAIAAKARGQ